MNKERTCSYQLSRVLENAELEKVNGAGSFHAGTTLTVSYQNGISDHSLDYQPL